MPGQASHASNVEDWSIATAVSTVHALPERAAAAAPSSASLGRRGIAPRQRHDDRASQENLEALGKPLAPTCLRLRRLGHDEAESLHR